VGERVAQADINPAFSVQPNTLRSFTRTGSKRQCPKLGVSVNQCRQGLSLPEALESYVIVLFHRVPLAQGTGGPYHRMRAWGSTSTTLDICTIAIENKTLQPFPK